MAELLFRTVHGSRLYGTAHADSDYDWFEVYGFEKGRSKQKITGDLDVVRTSLDSFLWSASRGVPQFLEAMFSTQAEVNKIRYITEVFRPGMVETRTTYKRTIKSLWKKGLETDNLKFCRHAVRLHLNLEQMEAGGRFDPTLDKWGKYYVDYWTSVDPAVTEYRLGFELHGHIGD